MSTEKIFCVACRNAGVQDATHIPGAKVCIRYCSHHVMQLSEGTMLTLDPFIGVNGQGVIYAQTPCWSLLAMPVPDVLSEEAEEYRRQERRRQRLFS